MVSQVVKSKNRIGHFTAIPINRAIEIPAHHMLPYAIELLRLSLKFPFGGFAEGSYIRLYFFCHLKLVLALVGRSDNSSFHIDFKAQAVRTTLKLTYGVEVVVNSFQRPVGVYTSPT